MIRQRESTRATCAGSETGTHRQWASVEKRFGDRTWDACTGLIRAGGIVVRCDVADVRDWKPRRLYLTRAWAAQAADVVRELRGLLVPFEARLNLVTFIAGVPALEDEATLLAAMPESDPLRVPRGTRTKRPGGQRTRRRSGLPGIGIDTNSREADD